MLHISVFFGIKCSNNTRRKTTKSFYKIPVLGGEKLREIVATLLTIKLECVRITLFHKVYPVEMTLFAPRD